MNRQLPAPNVIGELLRQLTDTLGIVKAEQAKRPHQATHRGDGHDEIRLQAAAAKRARRALKRAS